ncbi:hypothetical protein [Niabella soli]|uniref:Uncharacterized protein n=1 Tax=Niabella soli DSM 19437 TaxID=929713 RepID=W0F839_9BACT|nr:hypothetical protein [Niabella soli]AHF17983.1 hypothetical protein NIASO_18185 [Niabella soli DSM 19437]
MEQTKLSLSAQELAMVTDPGIILTKNGVLQKMQSALYALYAWQQDFVAKNNGLPAALFETNGKVAKGESYKGLPYVLLDYPRNFRQGHFFSIRSLFWWGRQVSTTLHLSGNQVQRWAPLLCRRISCLQEHHFYLSYSGDEWEHDLSEDTYSPLAEMTIDELQRITAHSRFLKIASFIAIGQLIDAPEFWRNRFRTLLEILFKPEEGGAV